MHKMLYISISTQPILTPGKFPFRFLNPIKEIARIMCIHKWICMFVSSLTPCIMAAKYILCLLLFDTLGNLKNMYLLFLSTLFKIALCDVFTEIFAIVANVPKSDPVKFLV